MATKRVKKWPPTEGKIDPAKGKTGSGANLSRDSKGEIKAKLGKDFAGVTSKTMKEDRKVRAGTGDGTYKGGPAPRTGGTQKLIKSGPIKSATKKVIRQSRRKPTGSPQARRSQRNNRF